MSERQTIHPERSPATTASLTEDLQRLGLRPGMVVLVHSSLSSLGWVSGGAQAVVLALLEAVGDAGTLVMPTHSAGLSEPSYWQAPAVPEAWWATIRETMPAFDPHLTPTRGMGAIPECFRTHLHARRSEHPHSSFAAMGVHAADVTRQHGLDFSLGETSPLARLYELDARVLLLGVGHDRNTSLHLAEARAEFTGKRVVEQGGPVSVAGRRQWATFEEWNYQDDDFEALGAAFEETGGVTEGRVGAARARLMPQRALVDFAVSWLARSR